MRKAPSAAPWFEIGSTLAVVGLVGASVSPIWPTNLPWPAHGLLFVVGILLLRLSREERAATATLRFLAAGGLALTFAPIWIGLSARLGWRFGPEAESYAGWAGAALLTLASAVVPFALAIPLAAQLRRAVRTTKGFRS